MKKLLLLTRFVKEYEPVRLREEAVKAGLTVDIVKYGQISLGVVGGKTEVDLGRGRKLSDYEYILPRAASKKGDSMTGVKTAVLAMAGKLGKAKVLNGGTFARYPLLGKLEQGLALAQVGLPTVDFVSFGNKQGWVEFQEEPAFDFPMMVKGRFGSHGRTVRKVDDWAEFEAVFGQYKAGSVLVQPQLSVRQWYRCIVVGGKYLGQMRHRQKDKYGGEEGAMLKLSESKMKRLEEICLRAGELFGVEYAGIDVVYDEETRDFKILEVNRTAQFKYFEKRTGVNVARSMIEQLIKN